MRKVRERCVARDGHCRAYAAGFGACHYVSEWAHLGDQKRFRTRGMPPDKRHTKWGSLMLCRTHHHDYDHGKLLIDAGPLGADGPLDFTDTRTGLHYEEPR